MELSAPSGIVEQEQLDAFRQFMQNDLSPLERSVAHFYLSGYSYDEIAKKTGTKRKSVDNAMTRIPVSYTHLDVYKRQACQSMPIPPCIVWPPDLKP